MKLTNKIALISGLGCLALVGTGFAAWTYTESNTANSAAAGTVASIKTAGTVAVTGTLSFVIDQADSEYNGKLVWSGTVTPVSARVDCPRRGGARWNSSSPPTT